jgi:CubicO group peptidase (beta-lactamase class C family)
MVRRVINPMPVLTLVLLAGCAVAAGGGRGLPPTQQSSIDVLFRDYTGQVPGASVIVVRDGRVLYQQAYGLSNLSPATPATPTTDYRLASLTKEFTALSVMLLARDGKLRFDEPIEYLLPGLPPHLRKLSVRQLLTHTSGIWDYEDLIPDTQTVQVSDADVLAMIQKKDTLYFRPGTKFQYSNTAYVLLGLIVERTSGMTFPRFLDDRIFKPAGMTNTLLFEKSGPPVPERAWGYTPDSGASTFKATDQSVTSATRGDGGIYSSVVDMAKWSGALWGTALLDQRRLAEGFTSGVLQDGTKTGYGFGWYVDTFRGARRLWHHGETSGFRNTIVRFPDLQATIVVLSSRNGGDTGKIADQIADLVFFPKGPQ